MKIIKILLLFIFLTNIKIIAQKSDYPIYIKLNFNKEPEGDSYPWERKVLPDSISWAKQSYDGKNWENVPELPRRVKVGIALAGGGIRGIAHIGVLRALEENNIPIHAIAGTSMGAIVGGLYSCGYSIDTLEWIVTNEINWKDILSDQPPRRFRPLWARLKDKPREPGIDLNITWKLKPIISLDLGTGLRTAQKYTDELAKMSLGADYRAGFKFENLPIPFGAILTDLTSGKSKLMCEGTISTAGRASGSLPIIFEPMKVGGIPYADGGILDDLPVDAFIQFDSIRAPDNMMNIIGKDTIKYVIAVYPLKMRGMRDMVTEVPTLSGPLGIGIGVMSRTSNMARDYHVWNSWDAAHGKIDIDVEGWFDFNPEKLKAVYISGYNAAWREIYQIKKEIVAFEETLRQSNQPQSIHQISSIKIISIIKNDTNLIKERKVKERIKRAIRIKEGSYVEKIDICDAIKRIYDLGDFEEVISKIEEKGEDWVLTFFVKEKENYDDSLKVILKTGSVSLCDSLIEEVVKDAIKDKGRVLNYNEIKELIERSFVKQGFALSRLDSIKFCPSKGIYDTLFIYASKGTYINGIKIICKNERLKKILEKEFNKTFRSIKFHGNEINEPFCPYKVLERASYLYKEFCLKTIAVEGLKGDSLVIAAERKSTHTLEFPNVTLETYEGLNLFFEIRSRRWIYWTSYFSYAYNFPTKLSHDLPQGHEVILGADRPISFSLIPDLKAKWKRLRFLSEQAGIAFDRELVEVSGELALPLYMGNFAFIPGFEYALVTKGADRKIAEINEDKIWFGQGAGFLKLRFDNLDREIFPDLGWKLGINTMIGKENDFWWNRLSLRIKGVPFRYRIQNRVTMILSTNIFGSWYSENTPDHKHYALGGYTPIGSYKLNVFDSEDFPGYRSGEIMEPLMWKAGGSIRLALMEMLLLGIKFNIHLEGSVYFADAIPRGEPFLSKSRELMVSPEAGLYIDTSYLNVGFKIMRTYKSADPGSITRFFNNLHVSIVYYGLGF